MTTLLIPQEFVTAFNAFQSKNELINTTMMKAMQVMFRDGYDLGYAKGLAEAKALKVLKLGKATK